MSGIQMIWIIIGFAVLILGALAFMYMPGIVANPIGAIGLFIWLIIIIAIFEYARLNDPWYDAIAITLGEIIAGIGTLYVWVKKSITEMDRRIEEFKTHQKEIFSRSEKHLEMKLSEFEKRINIHLEHINEKISGLN